MVTSHLIDITHHHVCKMATLPVPVLTNIFSFLSFFERRNIVQLVCKRWRHAAIDPILWKDSSCLINMYFVENSKSVRPWLGPELDIEDMDKLSNDLARRGIRRVQFNKFCPQNLIFNVCSTAGYRISFLSLKACLNLNHGDYLELFMIIPNLQYLDISNCMEVGKFINNDLWRSNADWHKSMSKLKHIDLGHTNLELTESYVSFLLHLSSISPLITSIGLSGLKTKLEMEGKLLCTLQSFSDLEDLDVMHTNISIMFLEMAATLFNLKMIKFSDDCSLIKSNANYKWLSKMNHLQNLCIHDIEDFSYWDFLRKICHGKLNLKVLKIHKCSPIGSRKYTINQKVNFLKNSTSLKCDSFCNSFSSMKELSLTNCHIKDEDLSILCEYLQSVEYLDISGSLITDKSILKISKHLTNLRRLDISQCFKLTDAAFLAENCDREMMAKQQGDDAKIFNLTNLEWLAFNSCIQLTDNALTAIYDLKNLRSLSFRGCINVTNDGVKKLVQNVKLLHCLNVSLLSLDDDCIEIVVQNLNFLTSLNISQIPSLTGKSLDAIKEHCKYLKYLDISHCDNITGHECAKFQQEYGHRCVEFVS